MNPRTKDLTGNKYGYLTVVEYIGVIKTRACWKVECVCGSIRIKPGYDLGRKGDFQSCGCKQSETMRVKSTTHGMYEHPAYNSWRGTIARCYNLSNARYKDYGGRGITVCERWKQSFENFWEDMGPSHKKGLTIDRIDNNGNYNKENCQWSDLETQMNNKRNNIWIETPNGLMTLAQAGRSFGLGIGIIRGRLKNGWSIERACLTQVYKNG